MSGAAVERKEWVKATSSPSGTLVTVSLVEGNASARSTVKAYSVTIKEGVETARRSAEKMLAALLEATG